MESLNKKLKTGAIMLGIAGILAGFTTSKIYSHKMHSVAKSAGFNENHITGIFKKFEELSEKIQLLENENMQRRSYAGDNSLYSDPQKNGEYEKLKEELINLGQRIYEINEYNSCKTTGDYFAGVSALALMLALGKNHRQIPEDFYRREIKKQ